MNRRSFLKLAAATIAVPYLPNIAVPSKVLSETGPLFLISTKFVEQYAEGLKTLCEHRESRLMKVNHGSH